MASRKATKKTRGKATKAGVTVGTMARAIKKAAKKVVGRKSESRPSKARASSLDPEKSPVRAAPGRSATAAAAARPAAKTARASRRAQPEPKAAARRVANGKPKAEAEGSQIEQGSVAPSFALLDQDAQMLTSSSLAGRPYVLYFYPKDDTPGCTKEACDFRDSLARFGSRGIRVIGVSPDPVGSHARFRDKYGLNFTLLSDPDKELARAYGVWVMKQNYGREYMGVSRSTFLIDGDGIVRGVWRGVRVPGHIDEVLQHAQELA